MFSCGCLLQGTLADTASEMWSCCPGICPSQHAESVPDELYLGLDGDPSTTTCRPPFLIIVSSIFFSQLGMVEGHDETFYSAMLELFQGFTDSVFPPQKYSPQNN